MKPFQFKTLTLSLLATNALIFVTASHATSWTFSDALSQTKQSKISQYFYVGKGEQWDNIVYNAKYDTDPNTRVLVTYDDKPIYRTTIDGKGNLNFPIPSGSSGFHRLDFIVENRDETVKDNMCLEPPVHITSFENSEINFQASRTQLRLSDLPDALYNPKLNSKTPLKAIFDYNSKDLTESNMLARLIVGWEHARQIQWLSPAQRTNELADFRINIKRVPNLEAAPVQLDNSNGIPTLSIQYSTDEQLESVVRILLQPQLSSQLTSNSANIKNSVASPQWATARTFNSLADFGIEDFRIGLDKYNLSLQFPSVWEPSDSLSGVIALRSQTGLLEGSSISAWINEQLAGNIQLAYLEAEPFNRQFSILGAKVEEKPNYNLSLESSIIANSACLPAARGAVWVNTKDSKLTLPYTLKIGVMSASSSLAGTPTIAISDHPNSLGMAVTAMQSAKNMLLTNNPVQLKIVAFNPAKPQKVNIRVDSAMYQQLVKQHEHMLYAPTAQDGFFAVFVKDNVHFITNNELGANTFNQYWPTIQSQIPNNVEQIFVSSEGQLHILENISPVKTQQAVIEQSNSFLWLMLGLFAIVVIMLLLLWRKRKNDTKKGA